MLTVVGLKVPLPDESVGVTVGVPVIVPLAPTVKLAEAVLIPPEDGPESVTAVSPPPDAPTRLKPKPKQLVTAAASEQVNVSVIVTDAAPALSNTKPPIFVASPVCE